MARSPECRPPPPSAVGSQSPGAANLAAKVVANGEILIPQPQAVGTVTASQGHSIDAQKQRGGQKLVGQIEGFTDLAGPIDFASDRAGDPNRQQKITVFARPYRYQGQKPSHYQGIGGSGEFIERELLQVTWKVVSSGFHFQNLSVDDLAFLYDNTLVPRERAARSLARTALPSG
jgi:hypothetical protein